MITPTRPGYTFTGWKDINGTIVTGSNNATENLTIYSQWNEVQYKVKFNGNGGAGSTPSDTLTLNNPVELPGDYTRDNHTLLGWSFADDATAADFKVGEQITVEDAAGNTATKDFTITVAEESKDATSVYKFVGTILIVFSVLVLVGVVVYFVVSKVKLDKELKK